MLGLASTHGSAYDSATYRRDSLDCRMALLAIQQGLGILSERRLGTDPPYSFNPSSRWAVVAPAIFHCLSSGGLFHDAGGRFRRPGDSALPPRKPYRSPSAKSSRRRNRPWPVCRRALDRDRVFCWCRCTYSCCVTVLNGSISSSYEF